MKKRIAVIVAAGYGSWRKVADGTPLPKVLETIGNRPIIEHLVRTVKAVRPRFNQIVVVVNPMNGHLIREFLAPFKLEFAVQPARLGAAEAVRWGLNQVFTDLRHLPMRKCDFVSLFADMPFWTKRTIEQLLATHQQKKALMTMGTIKLDPCWTNPCLTRLSKYGRVIKDENGRVKYCVELKHASDSELASTYINPSLYAFDAGWFLGRLEQRRSEVHLEQKDDLAMALNQAEFHLPPFAQFAAEEERLDFIGGKLIVIPHPLEFHIPNEFEALGVNTEEELIDARGFSQSLVENRVERNKMEETFNRLLKVNA